MTSSGETDTVLFYTIAHFNVVFVLLSFRVTVSPIGNIDPATENVTPFIKVLQGQSLVTVSPKNEIRIPE